MNQTLKVLPKANIRLKLFATKAAPSPVLGQSLGQYGINIMDFCKKFNNKTRNLKEDILVSVVVKIYSQKNYDIQIKTPTSSYLLEKIASITPFPEDILTQNSKTSLSFGGTEKTKKDVKGKNSKEKGSSLKIKNQTQNGKTNKFILLKEIYHLAIFKKCDPLINHLKLQSVCKTLVGTAKSMNIPVLRYPLSKISS